jgi:hypothetical protein
VNDTEKNAARRLAKLFTAGLVVAMLAVGTMADAGFAAKKIKACTIVPQAKLETAVGNAFETPQNSGSAFITSSCRFPSADINGVDLNLFLASDVKAGIKGAAFGSFFATKKSFQNTYGSATPVPGIGKQAFTAFDGSSSVAQGSLLVLDGKNHAALIVLTGDGVTADNTIEHGKAVAALVLPKLK